MFSVHILWQYETFKTEDDEYQDAVIVNIFSSNEKAEAVRQAGQWIEEMEVQ